MSIAPLRRSPPKVGFVSCSAGKEIRKQPLGEIFRIADPRRTAIISIGGFRGKLRTAGVGHELPFAKHPVSGSYMRFADLSPTG